MTDPDEADRRIDALERELAQLQADGGYQQLEANLVLEKLKAVAAIAITAIGRMTIGLEDNIQRMADDLNGSGDR